MHIIEQAGRALYGEDWHGKLADELDIMPRTLRRIQKGEQPLTEGIREDVVGLCCARRADLRDIVASLMAPDDE
jgi:hypothetical protein